MSERGTSFFDTVIDRTLNNLRSAWRDVAESARNVIGAPVRPELSGDDTERLRERMRNCLEGRGGEVSSRGRAADLGHTYLALNATGALVRYRVSRTAPDHLGGAGGAAREIDRL